MTEAGADKCLPVHVFNSCVYITWTRVRFPGLSIAACGQRTNDRAGITERATDAWLIEALGQNAREANEVLTVARPQAN